MTDSKMVVDINYLGDFFYFYINADKEEFWRNLKNVDIDLPPLVYIDLVRNLCKKHGKRINQEKFKNYELWLEDIHIFDLEDFGYWTLCDLKRSSMPHCG